MLLISFSTSYIILADPMTFSTVKSSNDDNDAKLMGQTFANLTK